MKCYILPFFIALMALGIVSCEETRKPAPPPPVVVQAPDYKPIGEGLKVHSYALIGVAVIIAIAVMSRGKNN